MVRPPSPLSDSTLPVLLLRYIPTAVASCGVKPSNQADTLPVVVPVLPAAGRPKFAPAPVPLCTTFDIAYVVSAMTSGSKTAWVTGLAL